MCNTFECYSHYSKACHALLRDVNKVKMIILLCYWNLTLTLICQGHLFRMQYQKWMIISWFGEIVSVYMAKNGQVTVKAEFLTKLSWPCHLTVKMTRNVQNNIRNEFNALKSVGWNRGITLAYTLTNKKHKIFKMDDGGHFWFGYYAIRDRVAIKHIGDFSCLGTHWLISSEKLRQHLFANGSIGQAQYYIACRGSVVHHSQFL